MRLVFELFVSFLLWAGLFFLLVGTVGLIRMPDIYTRMHATSKCDTLGAGLILLGMILQMDNYNAIIKLILIGVCMWSINPVVSHTIGHISYLRDEHCCPGTFFRDCYEVPYPGKEMARKEDMHA